MCEKVRLRPFLVLVQGSDKDGAEVGCGCGGSLKHGNTVVTAGNPGGLFSDR